MTEHEQNILEAALEYGRRGWPIFPIKKGAKTPLNKNGCKGASCNELAIRAWWHKHPGANIGMNCATLQEYESLMLTSTQKKILMVMSR